MIEKLSFTIVLAKLNKFNHINFFIFMLIGSKVIF
jgi:hypothetical protein